MGYSSDEWDQEGVAFRALHAHAWTEFITSSGAWQRLDSTPPSALTGRSSGIPLDADANWESVDFEAADEAFEQSDYQSFGGY